MSSLLTVRYPPFPEPKAPGPGHRAGGRGGKVIAVTSLDDSGPGTLREAILTEGSRIVIFRISGIIALEKPLVISYPYITIAGQSAPDEWEKKFGLKTDDPSDAAKDNDKNGYTNIEEWLNGTDPTEYIDYQKPKNNKCPVLTVNGKISP